MARADRRDARGIPPVRTLSWWARLWRQFWAIPVACTIGALVAGIVLPGVESSVRIDSPLVFPGGTDGARSVLSTVASAMISVTGLVFSITMVVLQLASSQFTPRILGGFLASRITQVTFGVFVASFVFSLTVLRSVHDEFVPQLSVTLAYLLVVASVGCFLAFIHHITTSIQVAKVVVSIGDDTAALADDLYPEPDGGDATDAPPPSTWSPPPDAEGVPVPARVRHGDVVEIDLARLARLAEEGGGVLVLQKAVGDLVVTGQTLALAHGMELTDDLVEAVNHGVRTEQERTLQQDPGFGLRQLVDIAERALSPGINDPSTATLVVDQLHRLFRELLRRTDPDPRIRDADGVVRLVHLPQQIDRLLDLAVREVHHYGRDSAQVPQRLAAMLDDLRGSCLPQHRATVDELRAMVAAG